MDNMTPCICPHCRTASEQDRDALDVGNGVCPGCFAPMGLDTAIVGWDEDTLTLPQKDAST